MANLNSEAKIDRTSPEFSVLKKAYEYYVKTSGLTFDKLKQLDCIDVRNCTDIFDYSDIKNGQSYPKIRVDNRAFIQSVAIASFFNKIPCFEKGVIKYNTKNYCFFKIVDIDTEEEEARLLCVFVQHSLMDGYICSCEYEVYIYGDTSVQYRLLNTPNDILMDWMTNTFDVSDQDTLIAKKIAKSVQQNIDKLKDSMGQHLNLFLSTIVYMNHLFEQQTLSKGKSESKTHPVADTKYVQNPTQQRMVRRLGNIEITSEKKPRKPTEAYVRHYSVATWKCRATVRHLKSGKVVRVRECVKHRKALVGNNEPLPVTIQIK